MSRAVRPGANHVVPTHPPREAGQPSEPHELYAGNRYHTTESDSGREVLRYRGSM